MAKGIQKQQTSFFIELYESYESSPALKGLIQALSISGIPIGATIDSALCTYFNRIKAERLRFFFDELNSSDIVLTEEQIESNDFLYAYFKTVSYVLRTRSNEKIKRFAKILKKVYSGNLNVEEFDYYTSIFDDLTDKEFAILSIKYKYEQQNKSNPNNLNELQLTCTYWDDFKKEIVDQLNIKETEINSFLIRLQRTGCYMKPNGYWDESSDHIGNTMEFFKTIINIIEE